MYSPLVTLLLSLNYLAPTSAHPSAHISLRSKIYPHCISLYPGGQTLHIFPPSTSPLLSPSPSVQTQISMAFNRSPSSDPNADKTSIQLSFPPIPGFVYTSISVQITYTRALLDPNPTLSPYRSDNVFCTPGHTAEKSCEIPLTGALLQGNGWPLKRSEATAEAESAGLVKRTPGCSTLCSDNRTFYAAAFVEGVVNGVTYSGWAYDDRDADGDGTCFVKDGRGGCVGVERFWEWFIYCDFAE